MTGKAQFSEEEWARLKRAPFVAGMAITIADPGGPIEAFHETKATLQSVVDTGRSDGGLVGEAATEVEADAKAHHNPLSGFKPRSPDEIVEELRAVNDLVSAKATADEAQAFRDWLVRTAQAAAEAAKEGGFMGFKAVQVSEGEQRMLDRLAEALKA